MVTDISWVTVPNYFAVVMTHEHNIVRLYKKIGNKITSCKPPSVPAATFTEKIERRYINLERCHNLNIGWFSLTSKKYINTYRLGHLTYTNDFIPTLYKFPKEVEHLFKKHHNQVIFKDDFNFPAIQAKIDAMAQAAPFPNHPNSASPIEMLLMPAQPASLIHPPAHLEMPPKYVCDLLIQDAITKKETCPITYDPLTEENAVITSCFHVFSRAAFVEWQKKSNKCPSCRNMCAVDLRVE